MEAVGVAEALRVELGADLREVGFTGQNGCPGSPFPSGSTCMSLPPRLRSVSGASGSSSSLSLLTLMRVSRDVFEPVGSSAFASYT